MIINPIFNIIKKIKWVGAELHRIYSQLHYKFSESHLSLYHSYL